MYKIIGNSYVEISRNLYRLVGRTGVKFSRFIENPSIRTAGARAEVWSKFRPNVVWSPGRPIEVRGADRSKFGGGFRTC